MKILSIIVIMSGKEGSMIYQSIKCSSDYEMGYINHSTCAAAVVFVKWTY